MGTFKAGADKAGVGRIDEIGMKGGHIGEIVDKIIDQENVIIGIDTGELDPVAAEYTVERKDSPNHQRQAEKYGNQESDE